MLEHAVDRRTGHRLIRMFRLNVPLQCADGQVVVRLTERFDHEAARQGYTLPLRFDLLNHIHLCTFHRSLHSSSSFGALPYHSSELTKTCGHRLVVRPIAERRACATIV